MPPMPSERSDDLTAGAPIVVFGDDWKRFVSTLQHLFAHIVGRRTVVWVNSFGHRSPKLTVYDVRRAASKLYAMLRSRPKPSGGAYPARIVEPRALPWHDIPAVRELNTWSLLRDIRRSLAEVAPGRAPVLLAAPAAEGVVGKLGELAAIYFCMDDYAELPGVDRHIVGPLERRLLQKVDATIATAKALTALKRPAAGRVYQLPQGVNYGHFATQHATPADLAALPRPWIGFSGILSTACDFRIFGALADAFPDGSIVHVGLVQPGLRPPRLHNLKQLGFKDYAELPGYVQNFDVGIIPYVLNEWTRSVDSLKQLEYLAAGIPVVSSAIPEAFKYDEAVAIASDVSGFVEMVRAELIRAADPERRSARQALARQHSWECRADRLLSIIAEVVDDKAGPRLQQT